MNLKAKNILNIWGGGQLLAFSGIDGNTDSRNGLTARTSFKNTGLEIKLPVECTITFSESHPSEVFLAGDFFVLQTTAGAIKGAFTDAYHLLIEGNCSISDSDLVFLKTGNKTLIGVRDFFDKSKIDLNIDRMIAARSEWLGKIAIPEGLSASVSRTLAKALSQIKTQIYSPEGKITHYWSTPDRWPHRDMWLWDSVFHAAGLRHIDAGKAQEILDAVFELQQDNGFIPHQGTPYHHSKITQPPVLALGAKLVNEKYTDLPWLGKIFPKLEAYLEWNVKNRDTNGNGLLEWFIEGNPMCRSGESGMDNSPRFDAATQLDAVDFNSFMALEYKIMAEFATLLGEEKEAINFQNKHKKLCYMINEFLWNEDLGFYMDFDTKTQSQSEILASSGFLPLICGAPTQAQAEKLAAHLNNRETFATALPVSSIAACSAKYYSKDMWRGPVWTNLNWLIAYGLNNYGLKTEADNLISRTIEEQVKMYEKYGTFFEFYDDRCEVDPPQLLRKGKCAPEISPYNQVFHDYGWSGTLFIDMVYNGNCQKGERSCVITEKTPLLHTELSH